MIVLILGTGGREHALYRALSVDPEVSQVHVAPGNPGMANRHNIDMLDAEAIVKLAQKLAVELIVIGPEAPLVAGVGQRLRAFGFAVFGPDQTAAQLEGSKAFAKQIMAQAGVPTASFVSASTPIEMAEALDQFGPPYVVKNDGLASGKGVVVTKDRAQALAHAKSCGQVVIEEYLAGPEISLFVVCDGKMGVPLVPAQDFKRLSDGNAGPNTGGMGAYSPLPWAPTGLVDEVMITIVNPTLAQMRQRGTPFVGLLYVGLALTSSGLKVVEFNARFGDPETQVVLARLAAGLGGLLLGAATGRLAQTPAPVWRDEAAVAVVVAAKGYPSAPIKGGRIVLPADQAHAYILQAGTSLSSAGELVSAGGRVLNVIGTGIDLATARTNAYELVTQIKFDEGFYRSDIASC